jgi:hypothetical protein
MLTSAPALSRSLRRDPFALFLLFSLLLHFLPWLFLSLFPPTQVALPPEQLTEVELLPTPAPVPPAIAKVEPPVAKEPEPPPIKEEKPQAKPEERLPEQIVNPPDQTNDQIPEKTRLLSERNNSTKEQTIAVGNPVPSPPQKERSVAKEKPEAKKPPTQLALKTPEVKPTPKPPIEKPSEKALKEDQPQKSPAPGQPNASVPTPQLFARPDDLLAQGWLSGTGSEKDEKKTERTPPQGRDLIALAPPPRENFLSLPGPIGTPDFLPDVRQGNLTMLNTKAHRFAPFVRRVATRVFQHLIIHQRKQLHLDDVVAAREMVQVEAKLDMQGNLKKLVIQTRSGSYAVDESLLKACEQGAWDENPPTEAQAEDGYIHFIFRSDINAQFDQIGLRAIVTYLQVGLV